METSNNERLLNAFEYLKKSDQIKTYVSFGVIIGENKAGVNDLKKGRKKASIEHFISLKKLYPEFNSDFFLAASSQMLLERNEVQQQNNSHGIPDGAEAQHELIQALRETIIAKNETIEALKNLNNR